MTLFSLTPSKRLQLEGAGHAHIEAGIAGAFERIVAEVAGTVGKRLPSWLASEPAKMLYGLPAWRSGRVPQGLAEVAPNRAGRSKSGPQKPVHKRSAGKIKTRRKK